MTRLIDADALDAEMYRKSFETDDGRQRWDSGLWIRYKIFEEARDEQPTVDAVLVIRCKDCKHCSIDNYADGNVPIYECTFWDNGTSADGYCHEAQGKEE